MQERWNDNMKVVIVGGVAGGATAAARIRRLNEQAEIVVFERSGYISYANCGLPYYIGDVITDPEELTLQTPESFFSRFRIMMKVLHEVTAIHHDRKTVSVRNLKTGEEFEEGYDKLILSPGAKPTQPKLSGMEANKLFTLRTVEDTFKIKAYINNNHPKSAVIAGGGFIGLELAENLRELGMDVTIEIPAQVDWGGQMAYLIGWGSPFDADDHTYKVFGTDKGANYSGYSNELVDQYLTEARQSDDPEVRKEAYDKFQVELANDPAYAFICYIDANYVADADIQGIDPDTIMGHHGVGIFWNVADWTIQ